MPGKETLLVAGRQYEELSWKWRLNRLVLEVASLTRNQSRGLGGATFDEKSVPPWTRGDFRGVLGRNSQLGVGCRSGNPPRRFAPPLRRRGFSKSITGQAFPGGRDLASSCRLEDHVTSRRTERVFSAQLCRVAGHIRRFRRPRHAAPSSLAPAHTNPSTAHGSDPPIP